MSEARWSGGCLCGSCRYEFSSADPHAGYCHRNMCKRATGGAFATLVQAPLAAFEWTQGKARIYRSSPIAIRGFCPDCGTPLFLRYDDDELIRVTVGSLDHPQRVVPSSHYGVESRLGWADIGLDLPQEETRERF